MKRKKTELPIRITAALALLAAISIVCGKYLAISGGDILRFSFENLPILFAAISFGPWLGALVAVVADLVGCLLVGYAINPLVTLGAMALAITAGLLYRQLARTRVNKTALIFIVTFSAHLVGSVLIKTFGLSAYYDMPFIVLMLWRLLNYVIVGGVEASLLSALEASTAVKRATSRIIKGDS